MKGRESTNIVGDGGYKEKMQRKKKYRGGESERKEAEASGREGEKHKRQGEQVRGGGIRAGDGTFRPSVSCAL